MTELPLFEPELNVTLVCSICHKEMGYSSEWIVGYHIGADQIIDQYHPRKHKLYCMRCGENEKRRKDKQRNNEEFKCDYCGRIVGEEGEGFIKLTRDMDEETAIRACTKHSKQAWKDYDKLGEKQNNKCTSCGGEIKTVAHALFPLNRPMQFLCGQCYSSQYPRIWGE